MKIGITERGDAGIDLSWGSRINEMDFAIIITKNVGAPGFAEELMKYKNKVILHATVTGFGGTPVEPNVPSPQESYIAIKKVIEMGFPIEQIVLRVDPIIPTDKGIEQARSVMGYFKPLGIKRCRISILDMYPHVKERFRQHNIRVPYESFTAPAHMKAKWMFMLNEFKDIYEFEACAEDLPFATGCISHKDMAILKIEPDQEDEANPFRQRTMCLCLTGKTELLTKKKQCPHGCLYCYWKNEQRKKSH